MNAKTFFKKQYNNLEIWDISKAGWEQKLEKRYINALYSNRKPFENILLLVKLHKGKTLIIEKEYIDKDYQDEFSYFYCSTLAVYPRECNRLHFFTTQIDESSLYDLEKFARYYIGYCIIRPILAFAIGRTVLKPKIFDTNRQYYLTTVNSKVNLSGSSFEVKGAPFIQQDTNVGVCAQASLWMVSLYMHHKFNFPRVLPSKISSYATQFLTRGTRGLTRDQLTEALRKLGFNPVFFPCSTTTETAKIIYSYFESEIPVILILSFPDTQEGHAVVAIGHTFNYLHEPIRDPNLPQQTFKHNIEWIDKFIINDDAMGPYQFLSVIKNGDTPYSVEENVTGILVPSFPEVNLNAKYAMIHSEELINNINRYLIDFKASNLIFPEERLRNLVLRTYLLPSNMYKEYLKNRSDMDFFLRMKYRSIRMPKYIWVTELSTKDLISKRNSSQRKIIGEIILDSTASEYTNLNSWLTFHLDGRLIIRKPGPETAANDLFYKSGEKPYRHFVRNA